MTKDEAKKILQLATDTITNGDKIYIDRSYVLAILDMIDTTPLELQPGTDKGNSPVWPPVWPPTQPQVWYGDDSGAGFEKVPWWVWFKNQYDFTCNGGSTGSKPGDPTTVDMSIKRTDYINDFEPSTN